MIGFHIQKTQTSIDIKPATRKTLLIAMKEELKKFPQTKVMQIHTHVPRGYIETKINKPEIKKFVKRNKIKLYSHSTYPTTSIWKYGDDIKADNVSPNTKAYTVMKSLESQCRSISLCGGLGVVVHIPKNTIEYMSKCLPFMNRIAKKYSINILLENIAASRTIGNGMAYANSDEIISLMNMVIPYENIKLCIDTAHLWSCGLNLRNTKVLTDWCDDLMETNKKLFKKTVKLIHLNGNLNPLGYAKDQHSPVALEEDQIWKQKKSKLKYLLCRLKPFNLDFVMEVKQSTLLKMKQSSNYVYRCLKY